MMPSAHHHLSKLLEVPAACLRNRNESRENRTVSAALAILARRMQKREVLAGAAEVADFLWLKAHSLTQEVVAVLFLDSRLRLIAYEPMFYGTLTEAIVYPREVAKRALTLNAASVILHHNHPDSTCTPTAADRDMTMQLRSSLAQVGVDVIDHVVSGVDGVSSMAVAGLL